MSQTRPTPVFATHVKRRRAMKENRYGYGSPCKARIYVSLGAKLEAYYASGESPAYHAPDAVWAAYNALQVAAMTDAVTRYLADFENIIVPKGALKFSRKAGCRCGCSPGFIASDAFTRGALNQHDLHLELDLGSTSTALTDKAAQFDARLSLIHASTEVAA